MYKKDKTTNKLITRSLLGTRIMVLNPIFLFNCTVPTIKIFNVEYLIETGQVYFLIKADRKNNITSRFQDHLPLLNPADYTGQLVQCPPGLRPPVPSSCITSHCLKHPQQTHPHPFTNHCKNFNPFWNNRIS